MISLNTPIGHDGFELLNTIGLQDRAIEQCAARDQLERYLRRLQPVERAALVAVRSGEMEIDEAARRLGKSVLATTRLVNGASRKFVGRKRRRGVPAPLAGVECPVGTIRVRRRSGQAHARYIKIAMTGRKRWVLFARWQWEKHHGPVPAGRQVLHLDGDSLNDDPTNLTLGGHADRAYLFQSRSERNYAKAMSACREGCRRHNRERAIARDLVGELRAGKWYAVDHDAKRIIGPLGKRTIGSACTAFGLTPPVVATSTSPLPWIASQLGWPSESSAVATVLSVLAVKPKDDWCRSEIKQYAESFRDRIGRPIEATVTWMNQALHSAVSQNSITRIATGKYRIAQATYDRRGPICMHAFLRGRDCMKFKDVGYQVTPHLSPETT